MIPIGLSVAAWIFVWFAVCVIGLFLHLDAAEYGYRWACWWEWPFLIISGVTLGGLSLGLIYILFYPFI